MVDIENGKPAKAEEMDTVPMFTAPAGAPGYTSPKGGNGHPEHTYEEKPVQKGLLLNTSETMMEDLQNLINKGQLAQALKSDAAALFHPKTGWKVWVSMFFPCFSWLSTYNWKKNIVTDVIAGLSVGAMIVPQSIAYAGIAKLPANIGLFSAMTPIYMYVIFGTCKELAPGPTALNAIMVGSVLPAIFGGVELPGNPNLPDSLEQQQIQVAYNITAHQLALACALFYLFIGLVRLGFLVNFLSSSVTSGFTTAAGLFIIAAQFKYLSGIKVKKPCSTLIQYIEQYSHYYYMFNWQSFVIGCLLCALLTGMKKAGAKWHKLMILKAIGPLVVATLGIILSAALHFEKHHIKTVKYIPPGLPKPTFHAWTKVGQAFLIDNERRYQQPDYKEDPTFNDQEYVFQPIRGWQDLLGQAWPITFIGLIEGVSTARTIATRLKYDVNVNKEITAFSVVNFANAAFQGYPGSGSMVRSAVAFGTGCKSQIYSVVVATIVMIAILALRPVFQFMPLCALAAIVISGCFSLLEFDEAVFLWKSSKLDFATWMLAFIFTVFMGLKDGVVLSVIISLIIVLSRSAFPHTNRLGRAGGPDSDEYRPTQDTREELEVHPEVLLIGVEQAVYFANSNHVKDKMYQMAKQAGAEASLEEKRLRYVVLSLAGTPHVDSTVMHMLTDASAYFGGDGVRFILTDVNESSRLLLRKGKVLDKIGERYVFGTLHQANLYALDMIRSGKEEQISVTIDDHH